MDLREIHDRIKAIINKDVGRYFTPEEIDSFLDIAQMDEFNALLGSLRQPIYNIGKTQRFIEELLPFQVYKLLQNGDRNGIIGRNTYDLPSDVMYISLVQKGLTSIDLLDLMDINARLNSEIIPPTELEPIAHFYNQGAVKRLRVYPVTVTDIDVYYYKRPDKPNFVYFESGRSLVYSQDASTQLEWNDTMIQTIINRALGYMGVNLAASDITQYGEIKQQ